MFSKKRHNAVPFFVIWVKPRSDHAVDVGLFCFTTREQIIVSGPFMARASNASHRMKSMTTARALADLPNYQLSIRELNRNGAFFVYFYFVTF